MTEQKDVHAQRVGDQTVEGGKDTVIQLIHKHVGVRQRVNVDLAGVEEAAEAIMAALTPAASDNPFAQALADICDDLGCARDNEAALASIKQLRDQVEKLTNTIKRIDAINDNPARFNVEIDEVCRPFTSTVGEPK